MSNIKKKKIKIKVEKTKRNILHYSIKVSSSFIHCPLYLKKKKKTL